MAFRSIIWVFVSTIWPSYRQSFTILHGVPLFGVNIPLFQTKFHYLAQWSTISQNTPSGRGPWFKDKLYRTVILIGKNDCKLLLIGSSYGSIALCC